MNEWEVIIEVFGDASRWIAINVRANTEAKAKKFAMDKIEKKYGKSCLHQIVSIQRNQ